MYSNYISSNCLSAERYISANLINIQLCVMNTAICIVVVTYAPGPGLSKCQLTVGYSLSISQLLLTYSTKLVLFV